MMMTTSFLPLSLGVVFFFFFWAPSQLQTTVVVVAQEQYLDRFTYQSETIDRGDGFFDYSPAEWRQIECNVETSLDDCIGYIDKWKTGRDWSIEENDCKFCPDITDRVNFDCGRHHQSPIDLRREYGLEPGTHPNANECIDLHWMKYEDSFCTLDQLQDADAFTIERHALRIAQPIEVYDDVADDTDGVPDGVRLMCRIPGRGSRFGRIDYSKGFSDWWHLSHIDVHVPSEHTQEGTRYDAEIQLYHFYSIPWWNEMGTVSVFMQAYDDAPIYRYLDKVICQWRRHEFNVRQQCGLDPIDGPSYPGCFPLKNENRDRNLRRTEEEPDSGSSAASSSQASSPRTKFQTVADVLMYNHKHREDANHVDVKIHLDEPDQEPAEEKDWNAWVQDQSDLLQRDDELYQKLKDEAIGGDHENNNDAELHEQFRRLIEGDNVPWHNYWPLIGVRYVTDCCLFFLQDGAEDAQCARRLRTHPNFLNFMRHTPQDRVLLPIPRNADHSTLLWSVDSR